MKKFFALLLAVLMISCMGMTVFAASDTDPSDNLYASKDSTNTTAPNEGNVDVIIKNDTQDTVDTVYHVVVSWDNLDFTFVFDQNISSAVWNPSTHTYTQENGNALTGLWDTDADGTGDANTASQKVVVTNHSNADVYVTASFKDDITTTNGVTSAIDKTDEQKLLSGVGVTPGNAYKVEYTVSVSGTPTLVTDFTVSTVILTVSANTGKNN